MADLVAWALGLSLAAVFVVLHFTKSASRPGREDIAQEVLQHRAESVPETDFPEPMNRSIGGGGAAGAIAGGESEGELAEEEAEEETGFDPDSIPEDEVEYHDVEFVKEGETIEVANNETLLDAGEDEGWDLPYACRQGQCVSCAGKVDGDATELTRLSNNEVLSDDELEQGYTLTCVAYPTESFSLETSESP